MYEIAIVGDLHITPKVSSRVDNYFDSCINKIKEISSKCKNIIFLGDFFDTPTLPSSYLIELYQTLNYLITTNNNKFYTIIGNHDIYNEREEDINKTSLGLLSATNTITLITVDNPVKINNYNFYTSYVNVNKCRKHLSEQKYLKQDILLLHQYYEDLYDCLKFDDLKDLGCNRIFFGHEHKPMEQLRTEYPQFTAYRCGSCGRNKADEYNLNRDVYYYILDNDELRCATLDCLQPGNVVFTEQAYTQENLKKKEFLKNINEVIGKYTNNINVQNKFSIYNILQEINTPEKCMQYIHNKYQQINEVFK